MEKEYGIFLNQGEKETQLAWRMQKLTAGQADITSMLCNLLKQQSAPDVDLDVFDRNPVEYHNFMTLFHELVEKQIEDPRWRLTRLIRYAKGDPKDMIQHCV